MTEAEWLACQDPKRMLDFLRRSQVSGRKLRLFAVACCRALKAVESGVVPEPVLRLVERWADGEADDADLAGVRAQAETQAMRILLAAPFWEAAPGMSRWALSCRKVDAGAQAALLRDLVGLQLFRPLAVPTPSLAWGDGLIAKLAEAIYDEGAFDRLPVLADAVEEAGCTDADLLGHCRGPGPHVLGCWALDALLEKS
jgi:hypothetical protein